MQFKRLSEFINYHNTGDGECNGVVLTKWADNHSLTKTERIDICYFFSITYCVESAIVMYKARGRIEKNAELWANSHKSKIIFQSDRKYIRMKNSFEKCLNTWVEHRPELYKLSDETTINLNKWVGIVEKYPLFGRFSAYLYLETAAWLLGADIVNTPMEWANGATATSGLLHIYGYDEAAEDYDKTRKLRAPLTQEKLQAMAEPLLKAIAESGGDNNITKVETSLCAYRKFFKGTRYNGYYLDRMLEEILSMKSNYPAISAELMAIRGELFSAEYLGEVGGWNGIRKFLKKFYKENGIIT